MPDTQINRECEIFLDAVEIEDTAERIAFLTQTCAGDTGLQHRIEVLIAADQMNNDSFMPEKGAAIVDDDETRQFIRVAAGLIEGLPEKAPRPKWGAPNVEAVNHFLSDYMRTHRKLGMGALGALYQGNHIETGKEITLRIIPPYFSESFSFQSEFYDRVRKLTNIKSNAIAPIYKFGSLEMGELRFFYVVSDFIEGISLSQQLANGDIQPGKFKEIIFELIEALKAGESAGLQHGYLSAGSVFYSLDGKLRITDFGINFDEPNSDIAALGAMLDATNLSEYSAVAKQAIQGDFQTLDAFLEAIQNT